MKSQEFPEFKANEVHIWSACLLEDENNMDYFYSILSEDERERAASFRFFKDQRRFTKGRGILRCLLSHYLGQAPESIEFIYGLWGKPYLSEEQSLRFNVSHSKDYALYAVTHHHEVGIDLEYIDKNFALEDMVVHIFSAAELDEWKTRDPQERINAFFRRWVSKEAFLKASGKGWLEDKEDKKEFPFHTKSSSKKRSLNDEMKNLYYFECISGYASALFVEGELLRPLHYSWNQNNFLFSMDSR